jgi:hypothetical protein
MTGVRENIKEFELNSVLEKIKMNKILTENEIKFLCEFDTIPEIDHANFSHLSKNQVFDKITYYLSKKKKVICDLKDKDGIINEQIISIVNDFENEYCVLYLKHDQICKIFDKFLYKITYNFQKDNYSLETQGEFYEKINIEK